MVLWFSCEGKPDGSTRSGSCLKRLRRQGHGLVSSDRMVEPGIKLYLGSFRPDHVISELCYKGITLLLQRNYKKITIPWPFFYNSFVNSMINNMGDTT